MALAFAAVLNLAIVLSWIWPERAGLQWTVTLWAAVSAIWCLSTARAWGRLGPLDHSAGGTRGEDLFLQAQAEYLKGHWFEAESLLERLLAGNFPDVDGQLMLAGLYRHTGRYEEARQQLQRLEQLDGATKWELEIRRERQLLQRLERSESSRSTGGRSPESGLQSASAAEETGLPNAA